MSDFKNPFVVGDVLWFEDMLGVHGWMTVVSPTFVRIRFPNDNVVDISLKEALNTHLEHQCDGPYRLAQAEKWSGYDFGETRDV